MNIKIISDFSSITENTYIFCSSKTDYIEFATYSNKLPSLQKKERAEFIRYQNAMIDEFRNQNQLNHVFMSSPFACENLWQSDFFSGLENLFQLKNLFKKKCDVTLFCSDYNWVSVIEKEIKGIGGIVCIANKKHFLTLCINKIYCLISQAYRCYQSIVYMKSLVPPFNKKTRKKINKIDIIFFSTWFQKTIENYQKDMTDPFFGKIPVNATNDKTKAAIFCHIEDFCKSNILKINNIEDVYSYFNILNIYDLCIIFVEICFAKILFPENYKDLKKCIKVDFLKTKWIQSLHALMIRHVTKKVILANPNIRIIHTFEGNCWEKGIIMAAKNKIDEYKVPTFGYQHTGFSEFFQKLRAPQFFFPEKILTSGQLASEFLIKKFSHHKKNIISTCYLRSSFAKSEPVKNTFPKVFNNVLVLLQGSPYDNLFIKEVELFLNNIFVNITIRPHPVMGIMKLKLPNNFLISGNKLHDDLIANDIVIHNGTTAALEAAYLGVPIIYIDLGLTFSSDIIIDVNNNMMIHRANKNNDFMQIVSKINSEPDSFPLHLSNFKSNYALYFSTLDLKKQIKIIKILTD